VLDPYVRRIPTAKIYYVTQLIKLSYIEGLK